MEVRIKDNNGYVDADWTIEDGVMVVSPKVEKFEPKDGDLVTDGDGSLFIYKESLNGSNVYVIVKDNLVVFKPVYTYNFYRFATEEEKKRFFVKLAEEGYEFDFEKKELIKLKWKPKEGEEFWLPIHYTYPHEFKPIMTLLNKERDKDTLDKGWCFKTKEECQEFCNRLNDAINSVKP
jgi:hypothetical protein